MLAFLYLIIMYIVGDMLCRRFLRFVSVAHRIATSLLCGLMLSSWWTYLASWCFQSTNSPLLWGNLVFFVTAIGLIYFLLRFPPRPDAYWKYETTGTAKWDWVLIGIFLVFTAWMMFKTLAFTDGVINIGHHEFPDFGSSLSIMQSFAVGHNFPTELPHFSGDRIRYHFLFYFQAGNLEYLGFNIAWANNILSFFTMTAMLTLIMTLGRLLFHSRVAGRIAAVLFFFHGSLAFIPFYRSSESLTALAEKVWNMTNFLSSGWPYRGEDWGVWSQVVFLNQRHFASAIGLFLVVLIFLVMRYREGAAAAEAAAAREAEAAAREREEAAAVAAAAGDKVEKDAAEAAVLAANNDADPGLEEIEEPNDAEPGYPASTDAIGIDIDEGKHDTTESAVVDDVQITERTSAAETLNVDPAAEMAVGDDDFGGSAQASSREDPGARYQDDGATYGNPDEFPDEESERALDTEAERPSMPVEPVTSARRKLRPSLPKWLSARSWFADPIDLRGVVFCAVVLGLLPMWNGAVFTTAFIVVGTMFLLFPLRRQLIILAVITGLLALPQLWYLTTGTRPAGYSIFRFGYTIENATFKDVFYYLGFTFGFKWLFVAIGLYFSKWLQRGLFIAASALILVAFSFRFSEEVLVNHKFLNIWLIIANLFVGYAVVRLWNMRLVGWAAPVRLLTVLLLIPVFFGGFIDLFPILTSHYIGIPYRDDRLINWLQVNTDPRAVFLTNQFVNHQILMAGRRVFYGEPYYAWGAGYDTSKRDQVFKRLFQVTDPNELFALLKENNISYVAIDDGIRNNNKLTRKANEAVYAAYFPLVFGENENLYGNIKIYKITDELSAPDPTKLPKSEATMTPGPAETFNVFTGDTGTEHGRLSAPRGLFIDGRGNIYVADTGNSRVEKFDPQGNYLTTYGVPGSGDGQLKEPNAVAVDSDGNVFVTDASNHRLLEFAADGKFVTDWRGPEPGFYGPRDIAMGPNRSLYIVDQGRTRIVRFDLTTQQFTAWGSAGDGEGQFVEPTGITIAGGYVYVADSLNDRVQVFDLDGKFVRQWAVPVWQKWGAHYPDLVVDEIAGRIYVTSGRTNEVLAFDMAGNQLENVKPSGGTVLANPSSIFISDTKSGRKLLILNTDSSKIATIDLESKPAK